MARPRKDASETATSAPMDDKLYPVKLLKNYRPGGEFAVQDRKDPEDEESDLVWREPTTAERAKCVAGKTLNVSASEAKRLLALRIGERADAFID